MLEILFKHQSFFMRRKINNSRIYHEKNNLRGPQLVMGCDALVDFFPGQRKMPISEKLSLLRKAYYTGINTFDVSVCENFIQAFKLLKDEFGENIVGIGNPNWKCGFKLNKEDLWDIKDRMRATLLEKCNSKEHACISALPLWSQERWFLPSKPIKALSEEEIRNIYLDKLKLINNLKLLNNYAKYVVFGSDYLDWFAKIGRIDLIIEALNIIKNNGFIPLSISHLPSIVAPFLNDLPFEGHWINFNMVEQLIVPEEAIYHIARLNKPVTVFRTLSAGKLSGNADEAIKYVIDKVNPDNLVIGISSIDDLYKIEPYGKGYKIKILHT